MARNSRAFGRQVLADDAADTHSFLQIRDPRRHA
jgi:hypothetical protein